MALMKVREVAARLGIGVETARQLLVTKQIPSVRLGDGPKARYRVDPQVLEQWIARRQSHTAADLVGALKSIKARKSEREALGLDEMHEFVN